MVTTRHSALEWARPVDEWRRSGLSSPEFCQRNGLKKGTMSGWDYKPSLKEVVENVRRGNADKPVIPASTTTLTTAVNPTTAFVPVRLRQHVTPPTTVPVSHSAVEVIIGAVRRVVVEKGFDAETLRRVVAALESGSC